ncbi:hypothetical protein Tco_0612442 [Tanacetum coccineum]
MCLIRLHELKSGSKNCPLLVPYSMTRPGLISEQWNETWLSDCQKQIAAILALDQFLQMWLNKDISKMLTRIHIKFHNGKQASSGYGQTKDNISCHHVTALAEVRLPGFIGIVKKLFLFKNTGLALRYEALVMRELNSGSDHHMHRLNGGFNQLYSAFIHKAIEVLEEAASKGHAFEKKDDWGIDLASKHERYYLILENSFRNRFTGTMFLVVLAEKQCQTVASLKFIINAWLQKALEDLVVEMDAMEKKEEES